MNKDLLRVLSEQEKKALIDAAQKFVKDNASDAAVLGAETVKAVLAQSVIEQMPPLPELPADANLDMRAAYEEECTARTQVAQLVATAQRQDWDRIAKMRESAAGIAGGLAKTALSIGFGLAVKALIGG